MGHVVKVMDGGLVAILHVPTGARRFPAVIVLGGSDGGIASANLDELFRPFEQHGADRTGLGLGLAFSRWGVEQNNGRIYVRNLPKQGCVFTVDLPRVVVGAVASV